MGVSGGSVWAFEERDGIRCFGRAFIPDVRDIHGTIIQGVYGFFLGLLLCLVREVYGTMKAPLLMHMTANGVSVAAMGSAVITGMQENIAAAWCLCSGCVLAGAVACTLRDKRWSKNV